MIECDGDVNEGCRKSDGFWGNVAVKCRHCNTDYLRKAIYMFWYKDTDNIREKFNNRVASEVVDNLNEVSTVIYDS
jgi:hypothetical protein